MDDTVLALLRDRFDKIDADNKLMLETFTTHAEKDATYWTKIDGQNAQISLVKWLSGCVSFTMNSPQYSLPASAVRK